MKTANVCLLGFLLLWLVPAMFIDPRMRVGLIGVGLILIPASYVTACYWRGREKTIQQIVKFGAFYNCAAACVLLFYFATSGTSHPVAFAIRDQVLSLLIGILAALNFLVFREWHRNLNRTDST